MPDVRIIRETKIGGSLVTLDIYVDNSLCCSLDNGRSDTIYVSGGKHAFQVRYDQVIEATWYERSNSPSHVKGQSHIVYFDISNDTALRVGFNGDLSRLFTGSGACYIRKE